MNILWLTEFFPATKIGEITGGVESRCFFVHKYLTSLSQNVTVIAKKTDGKRWAHLSFKSIPNGILFYFQLIIDVVSAVKKTRRFDLVEGTNYTTYPLVWVIGKIIRAKIVFWYPDVFLGSWVKNIGPAGIIGELVERLVLRLPIDRYITISESTKNKLIKAGIRGDKIEIVYCGVDYEEVADVKSLKSTKKYDLIVVSRLVSYKRVIDFITALAMLRDDFPSLKAIIVGQGPEMGHLKTEATKLALNSQVEFLGHVRSHLEVMRLISESKVFCFPTSAEGFGISAIEAAALGVPSVLSSIPVLREISRDGQSGLMFETGNAVDMARQIKLLLEDKNLYAQKAKQAIELSKKYSWEKISEKTLRVYQELLKS